MKGIAAEAALSANVMRVWAKNVSQRFSLLMPPDFFVTYAPTVQSVGGVHGYS